MTVCFHQEGRIISLFHDIYNLSFRIRRDRIFKAKRSHVFSGRPDFQHLRTLYLSRPYISAQRPYIFSLNGIFHGWPSWMIKGYWVESQTITILFILMRKIINSTQYPLRLSPMIGLQSLTLSVQMIMYFQGNDRIHSESKDLTMSVLRS